MKNYKLIQILTLLIIALAIITTITGIFSADPEESYSFTSVRGEEIIIQGGGVYLYDSMSAASQAIAQDAVTLFIGIPLLIMALILVRKASLRGQLLLAGTLGYFLYTYISMTFLVNYNSFFLFYVALYSLSLFAFILTLGMIDLAELKKRVSNRLPRKSIAGFMLFVGVLLIVLWLGRILPSLIEGAIPYGLEHYTTLVIQAMDLGLVVPVAILAAILLLKAEAWGYLLSSVVLIKGFTLLLAIDAMIVNMLRHGIDISLVEAMVFPLLTLVNAWLVAVLLKNISE